MRPIIGLLLMCVAFAAAATPIDDKYAALGGASGFLGKATIPESTTPDGAGKFRHYQGGSIYWHPSTGAHEVHGMIRGKWEALGWELGILGYPITDELKLATGNGRVSKFQKGAIYWHPAGGAFEVHGKIREKWDALGSENSTLGYPVTDVIDLVDGSGKVSRFLNGQILLRGETVSVVNAKDLVIDLPFPVGVPWLVGGTQTDHHANAWAYCFDFNLNLTGGLGKTVGAPFVSVADAKLVFVDESWDGDGPDSVVTQRLGEGRYAAYLHLAKGGYTKKAKTGSGIVFLPQESGGKPVKTGAVLGEIGVNDHLHFCITTAPDRPAFAPYESVPVAFRNYSVSTDQGKSWTFVPVGLLAAGQWVRRELAKAGVPAGPQLTGNVPVISHGTLKVRVLPGDGKPTGNGTLTIAVIAPWKEVLKTVTKQISQGAGPWDIVLASVPAYPGLRVQVEYKGPWSRAHDFVRAESAAFDVAPNKTKMTEVSLKTTLIH